ncbi:hypothetical protein C0Q70_16800 [Pomacea canaliculata]|uniref:Fukutin n=1 Tax=Pomacea canaliculata TaxID=400727 RepID=A0A2T7NQT8_POMCA|nr:fukutin-like [Pomacea canaliculata]PVD23528.1 hypothetical protein C0Q70_16800 [Pomacea canaliculata]
MGSLFEVRGYTIFKGIAALGVTFLLVQFIIYKIFVDKVEHRFDTSPWGVTRLFFETCQNLDLPVFAVEPSLLRALRAGENSLELWNRGQYPVLTFGVIEASQDELHGLLSSFNSFNHLEVVSGDPRELSSVESVQNYRVIPTHYFLWRPHSQAPLLHLVVFYRRGDYYWTGAASTDRNFRSLPLNVSHLILGIHASSLEIFSVVTEKFKGLPISYPKDTSSFIWNLQHSKFMECDYAQARHFFIKYGRKNMQDAEFRQKARQLLFLVVKTLDSMSVPFWLSSGTCLGWFRQCDIIPYSKDVDIGIRIKDYREEMITALENNGLHLIQLFGKVSDSLELSFAYKDIKLDIFFFYEEKDYIWNGGTQASTGRKFQYIFPLFSLCWTDFLGLRVRVPDPALPYIQANYGKKWDVPVRDWDWKKSPPNVVENGEWPPRERDQVIQLFEWENS